MRTPEELLQQLKEKYPRYNWTLDSKGWTILAVNKKGNSVYSLEDQDTDKEESIQNLLAGKVQYMSDGYLVPENETYLWEDDLYKVDPTLTEELEESLNKVELETDTEEIKIETKEKETLEEDLEEGIFDKKKIGVFNKHSGQGPSIAILDPKKEDEFIKKITGVNPQNYEVCEYTEKNGKVVKGKPVDKYNKIMLDREKEAQDFVAKKKEQDAQKAKEAEEQRKQELKKQPHWTRDPKTGAKIYRDLVDAEDIADAQFNESVKDRHIGLREKKQNMKESVLLDKSGEIETFIIKKVNGKYIGISDVTEDEFEGNTLEELIYEIKQDCNNSLEENDMTITSFEKDIIDDGRKYLGEIVVTYKYNMEEGLNYKDFEEFKKIADEIGLKTAEDVERFRKYEVQPGESDLEAIKRYRKELGDDFELQEGFFDRFKKKKEEPKSQKWGIFDTTSYRCVWDFDTEDEARDYFRNMSQSSQYRYTVRPITESLTEEKVETVEHEDGSITGGSKVYYLEYLNSAGDTYTKDEFSELADAQKQLKDLLSTYTKEGSDKVRGLLITDDEDNFYELYISEDGQKWEKDGEAVDEEIMACQKYPVESPISELIEPEQKYPVESPIAEAVEEEKVEEKLSNKEKLMRAYPELRLDEDTEEDCFLGQKECSECVTEELHSSVEDIVWEPLRNFAKQIDAELSKQGIEAMVASKEGYIILIQAADPSNISKVDDIVTRMAERNDMIPEIEKRGKNGEVHYYRFKRTAKVALKAEEISPEQKYPVQSPIAELIEPEQKYPVESPIAENLTEAEIADGVKINENKGKDWLDTLKSVDELNGEFKVGKFTVGVKSHKDGDNYMLTIRCEDMSETDSVEDLADAKAFIEDFLHAYNIDGDVEEFESNGETAQMVVLSTEAKKYVVDMVAGSFETGHGWYEDENEFVEDVTNDFEEAEAIKMYEFYQELIELGPVGFYDEYKDQYNFSDDYKAEYGYNDYDDEVDYDDEFDEAFDRALKGEMLVESYQQKHKRNSKPVSFDDEFTFTTIR